MHRRRSHRWPGVLVAVVLSLGTLVNAPAARAVQSTIGILYAPQAPLVANASQVFTAKLNPTIVGATVQWTVDGVLVATDDTNPNGVSQVLLVFGPGTYGVLATLVPGDGYDGAFSDTVLVQVDPDPARLPDRFSWSALGSPTQAASGEDARIHYLPQTGTPSNRLNASATSAASGAAMEISLLGPEGVDLAEGVYNPADTPRQTVDDAAGSVGNCDGGLSTGGFAVLHLERAPSGLPLAFTIVAEYRCANHEWPRVAWIRYNDTTPIPSLSLPEASAAFKAVIEGDRGDPVPFPITNDGEVPVTFGSVSLAGTDHADWELGDDTCSGTTLQPGDACAFQLTFEPAHAGPRTATIVLPSDLPVSPRRLRIGGQALIRTSVSAPIVTPEIQYLDNGVRFTATVSPATDANTVSCELDGDTIQGSGLTNSTGFCVGDHLAAGTHAVRIRYAGSPLDGSSTSPVTTFTVDPATTTMLAAGTGPRFSNVPVTLTSTTHFSGDLPYPGGIVTIEDTSTSTVLASGAVGPGAPAVHVTTTLAAGSHHVVATYAGIDGVEDPSSDSVDLVVGAADVQPPVVAAPSQRVLEGWVEAARVPVRLSWTGSDGGSGIDHYQVRRRIGDGAWTMVRDSISGTQLDLRLAPLSGSSYRFAVRAIDRAGNASPWMTAGSFVLAGVPDRDARIAYRGQWRERTGDAWSNGTVTTSSSRGATATLRFTGRAAAWVTALGPTRGRASVYVDGVLRRTIDLHAATRQTGRIAWSATWAVSGTHTVVIRVLGTPGRPWVDVDGFVITR